MKNNLLFLLLFCFQLNLIAQQDAWVYLKDKQDVSSSISNPITILTQKAINRKAKHNVAIDFRDVPVNESYIAILKNATGITVMAKSKWFNAVHVRGSETHINNLKSEFSFIDQIGFANKSLNAKSSKNKKSKKEYAKLENTFAVFNYGNALNQIEMFNGDELHLADYTGTGMTVAVLDAGFPNVNTMLAFKRLTDAGNLKESYDFVNRDEDVFTNNTSSHGTWVLSTMSGFIEDEYVGTAPDASYYLFITEDAPNENPVEESYWVEAAERADSLGVDVINTSLGYTTYDNSNYNYTNSDMNGDTAFITKGANIAFEKGMLLVNSAGNSGNSSWKIVSAPADSPRVLSVGAVKFDGTYASFSSQGSSIQPTQKPDVAAQGQASYVIGINDAIGTLDGTSFSSPILAGGILCLWQALPSLNNEEVMQLVRESASQYNSPDNFLGYGIPDLQLALNNGIDLVEMKDQDVELKLYPNPASKEIVVSMSLNDVVELNIFDVLGKLVIKKIVTKSNSLVNVSSLSNGMYIVKLQSGEKSKTIKFIKQ